MRVENKDDRSEMPEECDRCMTMTRRLTRYYHFGPGHNVDWLCKYCGHDFSHGQDKVVKSIAAMFNVLERSLKGR